MSPTSFPTISSGEAWDTGPGQASTLMNQITGAINGIEGGGAPSLRDIYLSPASASYETVPRSLVTGTLVGITGELDMTAIALPAGLTIGHLAFCSTTATTGGTHLWYALFNSSRQMLAVTADQTGATPWAATAALSLAVATVATGAASTFTTTYTGLYYLGMMQAASGASGRSVVTDSGSSVLNSIVPIISGSSNTGMTTPPAFPFTANALTSWNVRIYGYVAA